MTSPTTNLPSLRDKPGIIYLARNTVNGKCYVGQTVCKFRSRQNGHRASSSRGSKLPFHCAITKHGFDSFKFSVLQECCGRDCLHDAERWWISHLNTISPNGYNLTDGGEGASLSGRPRRISKEGLDRLRASARRQPIEKFRAMAALAGQVVYSPEARKHQLRGIEAYRQANRGPGNGRRWTPEERVKHKAKNATEETRRRRSEGHKGMSYPKGKDAKLYGIPRPKEVIDKIRSLALAREEQRKSEMASKSNQAALDFGHG